MPPKKLVFNKASFAKKKQETTLEDFEAALKTINVDEKKSLLDEESKESNDFSIDIRSDEYTTDVVSNIDDTEHTALLSVQEQPTVSSGHSHGGRECSSGSCQSSLPPEQEAKLQEYISKKKEEYEKQIEANNLILQQKSVEDTLTGAIFRENIGELSRMLMEGRNPDEFDANGEHSALHHAAYRSNINAANELVKYKANVNIRNLRGETPLMWACKANYLPMVHLLVSNGADINVQDNAGLQPIHHASDAGHCLLIDFLTLRGANINVLDSLNKSCLMWAAYNNHILLTLWLLSQSADPSIVDNEGYTFIHWAASQGHHELLKKVFSEYPELAELGLIKSNKGLDAIEIGEDKASQFPVPAMGRLHRLASMSISATIESHERNRRKCCGILGTIGDMINFLRGPLVLFFIVMLLSGVTVASIYHFRATMHMSLPINNIIMVVCLVIVLYNWCRILFGEPGGISKKSKPLKDRLCYDDLHEQYMDKLNKGVLVSESHCITCRIIRPLRSKHCSKCNRCVLKFDHHCPFLDQDIAAGNYHNFLIFVLFTFILMVNFAVHTFVWIKTFKYEDGTSMAFKDVFHLHPFVIVFSFHYFLYLILPTILFVQHVTLFGANETTNEHINQSKYPYFWLKGEQFFNPFSRGWIRNSLISFGLVKEKDYVSMEDLFADMPELVPVTPRSTIMNDNNKSAGWFNEALQTTNV